MRDYLFTVVFTNHDFEQVKASGRTQAVILAQAKQIEKGNSYMVAFVKNEENIVV